MLGNASYGGHDFTAKARTRMRVENVYTDSGQDVTHRKLIWEISDYVSVESGTTDGDFDTLKQKLERPRQAFTYTGRGAGVHSINVSSMNDVDMGPKPKIVAWNPVGASMALHFIWTVEMCVLPPCASGSSVITAGIKAWETDVEVEIDKYLRSRITYSGYIEIIQNTASTDSLEKSDYADFYRGVLGLECPPGFQPAGDEFRQGPIGNRLRFRVSYKEMYEILPPGILEGRGKHKIKNATSKTTCQWMTTLSCSFVVADPDHKELAFNAFMTILSNKMGRLLQGSAGYANVQSGISNGAGRGNWMDSHESYSQTDAGVQYISDIEIENGLMEDKEISFSVTILVAFGIDRIIQESGLFKRISGDRGSRALDWRKWKAGDTRNIMDGHRGLAGYNINGSQALVNLCTGDAPPPVGGSSQIDRETGWESDGGSAGPPISSYSVVEAELHCEESNAPGVVIHEPTGGASASQSAGGTPYAQNLGNGAGYIRMSGYIVGVNAPPPFPVPATVDGVPVQPLPSMVVRSILGQMGNAVLHGVVFNILVRVMAPAKGDVKDKQGRNLKVFNPQFPRTNQRGAASAGGSGGFPYTGAGGLIMGSSDSFQHGQAGGQFGQQFLRAAQAGLTGWYGDQDPPPALPTVRDAYFQQGSAGYQASLRQQGVNSGGGSDNY